MYTKWAARAGPLFRVKGALFHPDIVSLCVLSVSLAALTWLVGASHAAALLRGHDMRDCTRAPFHTQRLPFTVWLRELMH